MLICASEISKVGEGVIKVREGVVNEWDVGIFFGINGKTTGTKHTGE